MGDTRIVECPACEGEGRETVYHSTDWVDGPLYREIRCEECKGTGGVEIEAEPITLEDLESKQ